MLGVRKGAATVELGSLTMRRKGAPPPAPPVVPVEEGKKAPAVGAGKVSAEEVWEVRPGGMLVQKRGPEEDEPAPESVKPVPTIRVKAKLAGKTHEIYVSAEATFGDLRRRVAERAGAHPEDLRTLYKGKEQDPKAFLDMAGVRDRSKVAVVDDPEARARRLLEELRLGSLRKAAGAVAAVAAEVDKIAPKVSALEASVRKGEKVAEKDVATVTELLMNELLKLDAVVAGGDVKAQRRVQVKRVQKYVETLDAVMAKNATIESKPANAKKPQQAPQPPAPARQPQPQSQRQRQQQPPQQQQQPAAQTTRWEMFDLLSSLPTTSSSSSTTTDSSTASSAGAPPPPTNRLDWML
ncbi:BAG family molecular chaperone regulator 3-like [Triticum dicoccoides]|uniref:BAG family molecular chaperone regulator 3-like n=1 Tax=Triticum dicoccoides TaxID=85692 RepID=UPI000E786E8F|nr:BAG family molecular chaperone regulator 3-like [Triticum dicoccoides]